MSKYLTDILESGDILDNQEYYANKGKLFNFRLGEIQLKEPYGVKNAGFYRKVFDFLISDIGSINNKIKESKGDIFLFGRKNYEHNTDDPLIKLTGLDRNNFKLDTGNLIGEIKINGYKLKISSRFGNNFLRYIIADSEGFLEIEDSGGVHQKSSYEWLIYHLWLTKLRKAFRLGVPKSYVKKSEKLNYLRGNADLIDYYQNPESGKLTCEFRSLSSENAATSLIASVFKQNEKNTFLQNEINLRAAFYIASEGKFISSQQVNKVKPFSNPYYQPYNDVLSLSKLILNRKSLEFGNKENSSAFLFDVSMLFEYFVKRLFMRSGLNVLDKTSNTHKIPKGFGKKHELQPDIVIEEGRKFAIFDVKYKNFDFYHGVKREDLFQIHTYAGQYLNAGKVVSTGFVYPISQNKYNRYCNEGYFKEGKPYYHEELSIGNKNIDFYVFFVIVPEEKNFKTFQSLFSANNQAFQKEICNLI
ncbi:restriction endonuclease [Gramella sp. KN1008]|uniref:5-methylcytosine restriction system specificity protein McrC n=1 Tax=Gramella sp. KN1008 TaxID=2529298 RepID=UPI00103CC04D|nr:restriction endonuclease [Gramella sp. KN1008]TBW30250.1 restriction endonuclease [Gramella sp. KN1008]